MSAALFSKDSGHEQSSDNLVLGSGVDKEYELAVTALSSEPRLMLDALLMRAILDCFMLGKGDSNKSREGDSSNVAAALIDLL